MSRVIVVWGMPQGDDRSGGNGGLGGAIRTGIQTEQIVERAVLAEQEYDVVDLCDVRRFLEWGGRCLSRRNGQPRETMPPK